MAASHLKNEDLLIDGYQELERIETESRKPRRLLYELRAPLTVRNMNN